MSERPHCRYCGSSNVSVDATAKWDDTKGGWELADTHDSGACEDCGETLRYFDWRVSTDETSRRDSGAGENSAGAGCRQDRSNSASDGDPEAR